ncbi:UDP-N-acetylmuramoyl-L-alanyl-D-glutamate--2,6-diaminopimelate ligase [Calidifontibacter terrae]
MNLTSADLARVLSTEVPVDGEFTGVTHASNQVEPGGVFVAIKGFTSDGARFAPDAMTRGARLVVAQQPIDGIPTVVVPDARIALARLACAFAGNPSHDLTVYGVTGTNGKTTSSYVLHGILSTAYGQEATGLLTTAEIVVGTHREPAIRTTGEAPQVQGNLRRMLDGGVHHVVLETSSHGLALHRVLGTHYAAALFTNLTRDHLDFHPDMEDYYLTKRRLFEMTEGPRLTNADDSYGRRIAQEITGTLTYGAADDADYRIEDARIEGDGSAFVLNTPGGQAISLHTPLLGDYNIHNVAGAAAVVLEMGLPVETLVDAVAHIPQVPGRFERVPAARERGFEVVVDYAHTDDALRVLLEVAREVTNARGSDARLIVAYGAAGERDPGKRAPMGRIASQFGDINIITTDDAYSEDPQAIADEVMSGADPANTQIVLDRREAIRQALDQARPGDVVVVAGKGHERVQHLPTGDIEFHDATVVAQLLASSSAG